jgi:uncharacterized protein (TIGR02996 family)
MTEDGARAMNLVQDDSGFLEAIRAAPTDHTVRLVYADWLEERGDERAEYLRIQAELLQTARERKSTIEARQTLGEGKLHIWRNSVYETWVEPTDYRGPGLTEQAMDLRTQKLGAYNLRVQKALERVGGKEKELLATYRKNGWSILDVLVLGAGDGKSTKELQVKYATLRASIDPRWLQATDWPNPRPKAAIRCGFGLMHSWDGCVCIRCGAVSDDDMHHAWVGCRCIRCGQTIQAIPQPFLTLSGLEAGWHVFVGCQCSVCGLEGHDWDDGPNSFVERCRRCGLESVKGP